MTVIGGLVVPSSIFLVPEVGRGRERDAVRTVGALRRAGRLVAQCAPDALALLLPGAGLPALLTAASGRLRRDLRPYDAPEQSRDDVLDAVLSAALLDDGAAGLSVCAVEALPEITLAPLFFLSAQATIPLIVCSLTDRCDGARAVGEALARAAGQSGRRLLAVAVGELSSKLFRGAPGGYSAHAVAFDQQIVEALARGDLDAALLRSAADRAESGETLLPQIAALAAALGPEASFEVLSYEGPFGLGYLVASAIPAVSAPTSTVS